ncbi:hypothetical protein D3C72_2236520 [compost metagenome]
MFFPGASATHFTTSGALSAIGLANLRANLTRTQLVANVLTIKKVGNYHVAVDVEVVTQTNTITATTKTFDIAL